ncbi:MAG: tetratricopeptide repeat protein [Theionarchaea archaeon]|nr:tetratricopeptide repeat protein [Theionarchaea archaeon]
MSEELAITKLLADETNITILLLLRTQPLHCRKLSTILGKSESQIARRLSQLERAGILESEWVYRESNIKVYFLKTDSISIQITNEGIGITYSPAQKEKFFALESIFQVDIPGMDTFIDRESQLTLLDKSPFVVLTGIAGIGKTSLASFYARKLKDERSKKVFWHTFSELDSIFFVAKKLAVFLSTYGYLQLLDYLKADGSDLRVVEALLKDAMDSPDFAFFFDDYHFLTDDSMDQLFNQLKRVSEGKICVISRSRPSFVSVFDDTHEIRLEEMGNEAVSQLLESKGIQFHGEALEKVAEKVGGHPLALELLCQAVHEGGFDTIIDEIPASEIGTYLWDEIYSRLSPDEQQLLVVLSIFRNPVSISAVTHVYPLPHARTVIRQLLRKSLLKRVDGGYVHHAVTRLFCLRLLHDQDNLHRKAAEYYLGKETSHSIMEALHHLLEAKAYEKGADVILEHHEMLINEGYAQKLLFFCEKMDFLPLYNNLLLEVEGTIHLLQGEYDKAIQCFAVPLKEQDLVKASLYRRLGETYERKREYRKAEELFLQGLQTANDMVEEGTILVRLAAVYAGGGEPDKALSCCEEALARFSESGYKRGIAQVHSQMGEIYRFRNTDKALDLLSSSLEISNKIGDVREAASTLVTMGNVLYERGQTDEAVEYYQKSLNISESIGDMVGIARCCNNIGVKYALEWKWPHAMDYYRRTLSICQKIGDKKGISFAYSNLGRAYSRFGMWEKALEYLFASLHLSEELSDRREISNLYSNIGSTLMDMGDLQEALEWFQKSLAVREETKYTLGVAYSLTSMGRILSEQGEYENALQFLGRALEIHEREKGTWMTATVKAFCAQVHLYEGNFEKALSLSQDAVNSFEETDDIEMLVESHQVAAEAHLGLGNHEEALMHADRLLQCACRMDSLKFEGRARRVLGTILCEMNEFRRAEEEFRLSMRLLKEHNYDLAKTYVQFGLLLSKMGQGQKGKYLLQKALSIFENSHSKSNVQYCKQQLSLK